LFYCEVHFSSPFLHFASLSYTGDVDSETSCYSIRKNSKASDGLNAWVGFLFAFVTGNILWTSYVESLHVYKHQSDFSCLAAIYVYFSLNGFLFPLSFSIPLSFLRNISSCVCVCVILRVGRHLTPYVVESLQQPHGMVRCGPTLQVRVLLMPTLALGVGAGMQTLVCNMPELPTCFP
jgi:hypothetical protein